MSDFYIVKTRNNKNNELLILTLIADYGPTRNCSVAQVLNSRTLHTHSSFVSSELTLRYIEKPQDRPIIDNK